jgi:hypothetical protein
MVFQKEDDQFIEQRFVMRQTTQSRLAINQLPNRCSHFDSASF